MKLYYAPGACSLSPHIVAREAGIPIELEKVNLADHKTETGQDYMAVNPKGYVPALRFDDGSILTEGPAIVQYLADQKPTSGLAPAAGSPVTVADAYAFTVVHWTNFLGIDLKAYPNLTAYMGRVGGRPKVQEALKAEGLVK